MNKQEIIQLFLLYFQKDISLNNFITTLNKSKTVETSKINAIRDIHIKITEEDIGCTPDEADSLIRYTLFQLILDSTLSPENAEDKGYRWYRDVIFPIEGPNKVLLQFIEENTSKDSLLGLPAGTFPEELAGVYRKR